MEHGQVDSTLMKRWSTEAAAAQGQPDRSRANEGDQVSRSHSAWEPDAAELAGGAGAELAGALHQAAHPRGWRRRARGRHAQGDAGRGKPQVEGDGDSGSAWGAGEAPAS